MIVVDINKYREAREELERLKQEDLGMIATDNPAMIEEYVEDLDRLIKLATEIRDKLAKKRRPIDNWILIPMEKRESLFMEHVLDAALNVGILDEGR